MNKIIKNFFILFSILILITAVLIMIYYILPKNYELYDKNEMILNKNKKISLKLDEEYLIKYSTININIDIPVQIENWLKSETIVNDPNTIIKTRFNSSIKIKNTTQNDLEFTLYYEKNDIP